MEMERCLGRKASRKVSKVSIRNRDGRKKRKRPTKKIMDRSFSAITCT